MTRSAVDRAVKGAEFFDGGLDRARDLIGIGDVGARKDHRWTKLARELRAALAHVADDDFGAVARELGYARRA
jgi:hypothetical protein